MSLVGVNSAVISLGVSCQTTKQILFHQALFEQYFGEPLIEENHYFDYLICPVRAAESTLRLKSWFPQRKNLGMAHTPFWKTRGLYFWHSFSAHKTTPDELYRDYEKHKSKYRYLGAKLEGLRGKRIVIIVSNTQNSLETMHTETGRHFPRTLKAAELRALKRRADAFFGVKTQMLVVTRRGIFRGLWCPGINLAFIGPDGSKWEGDTVQWGEAISRFLSPKPFWPKLAGRFSAASRPVYNHPSDNLDAV